MEKIKYSLFYDFHTSPLIPDVGKNFQVEQFTDNLKACGVDFLTWHARCNQGNAYYNTRFGCRHPSLQYDLFREIAESCHRKGIRISAYFNGGLSDEELLQHRAWMRIAPDGRCLNEYRLTPYARATCYNSPFREHLKNMVREMAEEYPVDGFFFDCMSNQLTCVCPYCVREMKEKEIDYNNPGELGKFTGDSVLRLARELHDLIKSIRPEALFFLNGSMVDEMIGYDTQLECESLPTSASLGYEFLPVQAHYLRTVARGNPVLNMTGRFYEWGDFGGLRKEEGIEYDLFYGLANGMRPEVGGHFHPRGDMDQPVFDLIRSIYKKMQEYDFWCDDAVNHPEIAVIFPKSGNELRSDPSLKAATRMLCELKIQFDVVTEAASWESYDLLICPDSIRFSPETGRRISEHLQKGGAVIASGESGLNPEGSAFLLQAWSVVYLGPMPYSPYYFHPEGRLANGLPPMPLSVYAEGVLVKAKAGACIEMEVIKPYHNQEWDGLHANFYTPPQEKTDIPFITIKDRIACISGKIFAGYYNRSPYQLRSLLGNVIQALCPHLKLKAPTLPSFARAFVQQNGTMELIHILAYTPELRGKSIALEDRATLLNTELALRMDGKQVSRVYLAPKREPLPFSLEEDYCRISVPVICGYALVVIETV